MTAGPVNQIEGVFELHQAGDTPSPRLLVVFSAAHARNFTFFNATKEMKTDRLHIRDPNGNAWYQKGLADGEGIADIERRIREVAADYREIWMLGSSMGGYAALYLGARLQARRVLAIAPQVILDHRSDLGPSKATPIHTPDISRDVLEARQTQFTIVIGSFDLVDAYNISHLYQGDHIPMHFRVLQYQDEDHMLPDRINETCGLKTYFQSVLSDNRIPQNGMGYTEGRPLDDARLAILKDYFRSYLERDYSTAYETLLPCLETYPDWPALHFLALKCGLYGKTCDPAPLLPRAQTLSDRYPDAIDFAFLVAQQAENADQEDIARAALRRVFSIRSQHPAAQKMLERLNENPRIDKGP